MHTLRTPPPLHIKLCHEIYLNYGRRMMICQCDFLVYSKYAVMRLLVEDSDEGRGGGVITGPSA